MSKEYKIDKCNKIIDLIHRIDLHLITLKKEKLNTDNSYLSLIQIEKEYNILFNNRIKLEKILNILYYSI
jgi:hypothetical protein